METFIAMFNGQQVVLSPVDRALAAYVIRRGASNCVRSIYAPPYRTTIVRVWPNGRIVVSTIHNCMLP